MLVGIEFEDFDTDDNIEDLPESFYRLDIDRLWRDEANRLEWDLVCGGGLGVDVADSSGEGESAREVRVSGKKCRKSEGRSGHAARRRGKRDLAMGWGDRGVAEAPADAL